MIHCIKVHALCHNIAPDRITIGGMFFFHKHAASEIMIKKAQTKNGRNFT